MKKLIASIIVSSFIFCALMLSHPALAQNAMLGVNAPMGSMSVDQQNATLNDLHNSGIHFIRAGITPDDKGIDFARRAQAQGIKILWLVPIQFHPGAPTIPYPNAYNVWGGPGLSSADAGVFRSYFQPLLAKLEAAGITFAGFELGNEINSGPFNSDFVFTPPLPGQAKLFGYNDLVSNPQAQPAAKGFLQYLKLLAVLKDVRDHSALNQHTPIVSAGLVGTEEPEGPLGTGHRLNGASTNATIEFLRANGLDRLVDVYGIHFYPWSDNPGNTSSAAKRMNKLKQYDLAQCRPGGSASGKPCWVTEWGFTNTDDSCPIHEANQISLVREMMNDFRSYVQQRTLIGINYFAWLDKTYGVWRCNGLTETGRAALTPFK
jgi:hypothetical protein